MTLHLRSGIRIRTSFDHPPIPDRSMDWSAVTDNYEAWTESGEWTTTHPMGNGASEEEAISDLLEQIADRKEYADAHRPDPEPDSDRTLGLLNPITAPRRVGY